MRLLVFLHGTVIMHARAIDRAREEAGAQVRRRTDTSAVDFAAYVRVGGAVAKLRGWREQGAQIDYLSSQRSPHDVAQDASVPQKHGFPPGRTLARGPAESYGEVAGREMPDVLIEDDCESIGVDQITHPQIQPNLRSRVKSIVVPEFGGIDHFPHSVRALRTYEP